MEYPQHDPSRERDAKQEREPQPHDIALATREVLKEFAPDADPQDVKDFLDQIDGAVDFEEAEGYAMTAFTMLCDGADEEALQRLGEILQVEAILPGGDQANIPAE
jgi:hypothetical protein